MTYVCIIYFISNLANYIFEIKVILQNGANFLPEFFTLSLSQIGTVYTLSLGAAPF